MSTQITTAFVNQYGSSVFHLSQQSGSRFRGFVRAESQRGQKAFYDRIGTVTAQKRTTRHGDTPIIDTPHSRRMVVMSDYEHADLIDDQDRIRMLLDPRGPYQQAFADAFGRATDDEIITALSGTANTGVDGSGSQALGNGQRLAAVSGGSGSNLNVQALRRAKKLMDAAEVPKVGRNIAVNASAMENLLTETEVTSSDYNVVKALVMGDVDTFLGFKFHSSERLVTQSGALLFDLTAGTVGSGSGDADGYYKILCWQEQGLLLSVGEDIMTDIGQRRDKSMSTQVYMRMSLGAVRMEEVRVVEIHCAQ